MQTLFLEHHSDGPVTIVRATGVLDLHTQDDFEQMVSRLLCGSSVVVDLSRVEFVAICALRSLVACRNLAVSVGHEVFYAGPSTQLLRLLTVSGLADVLPIRASVDQAMCGSGVDGAVRGFPNQTLGDLPQLDVR